MTDPDELAARQKIIDAAGSGGSAQGRVPEGLGGLRFGESTFGGEDAVLLDDDGNALSAEDCGSGECHGSHIWGGSFYCAGPPQ
jgi:hypothetical protein